MKTPLIVHPILFAAFPVLFLFAHNIGEVRPGAVLIPSAVVLSGALLSYGLLAAASKNRQEAALIVSLFLALFFSYGHVASACERILDTYLPVAQVVGSADAFLYPVWNIFFIAGFFGIRKASHALRGLTRFLNIFAACLIAISLTQIFLYALRRQQVSVVNEVRGSGSGLQKQQSPRTYPDIYFLVLDGYARADVLQDIYHYDNREFMRQLTDRGFLVASKSSANYAQTELGLASALNMNYLDDLLEGIDTNSDDRGPLRTLITRSRVATFLRQHGYKVVAFASGFDPTEMTGADLYMADGAGIGEFQSVLINTTPLARLLGSLSKTDVSYESHRRRILYALEELPEVAKLKSPKFVFVHITAPHPPFVFGQYGEITQPRRAFLPWDGGHFMHLRGATRNEYVTGYIRQLAFISQKVSETLERILSISQQSPIIILQSDHGPGSQLDWESRERTNLDERLAILNAWHLPEGTVDLYDGISPVNTFRLLFNHYFDTDFKLLSDQSYFSTWSHPFKFVDVTCEINPCAAGTASGSPLPQ